MSAFEASTTNGNGKSHEKKTIPQAMPTISDAFSSDSSIVAAVELLSESDRDAAIALIAQVRDQLPNLRDLTVDERKSLSGMGEKNRSFARKVVEVIQQSPEFLPRSFDADRLQQNLIAYDRYSTILMAVNQLRDLLDATTIAIGSEAYNDALTAYRYAKASGQGASLDAMMAEMKQRFRKSKKKGEDQPESTES